MTNQAQKAKRFHKLHVPGKPLVLFNIWGPGSAKAVAETEDVYPLLAFSQIRRGRRRFKGSMKPAAISYGTKAAQPVWRVWRFLEIAAGLKLGVEYWRAAERDEKSGFPFTAALEWRKAAELFSPIPQFSDRCWQEWERLVHLPRRFARTNVESAVRPHWSLTPDSQKITDAVVNELPAAPRQFLEPSGEWSLKARGSSSPKSVRRTSTASCATSGTRHGNDGINRAA